MTVKIILKHINVIFIHRPEIFLYSTESTRTVGGSACYPMNNGSPLAAGKQPRAAYDSECAEL
jgi:hypothetical protein